MTNPSFTCDIELDVNGYACLLDVGIVIHSLGYAGDYHSPPEGPEYELVCASVIDVIDEDSEYPSLKFPAGDILSRLSDEEFEEAERLCFDRYLSWGNDDYGLE